LPGAVPPQLIDDLLRDEAAFRSACGETKDEHGFGKRIGVFHVANDNSRRVALTPRIVAATAELMGDDPLLMGSLTFEVGTQQDAHIDAIYFYVMPETSMVGAWVALEDIHPNAGPLFYYPGSHRWKFDKAGDVWQRWPELAQELPTLEPEQRADYANRMHARWNVLLHERIADERALPQLALIKKGDCFIWHGNLVHGGSARQNRALSRHSMVSHYIGSHSRLYDFPKFFLHTSHEFQHQAVVPHYEPGAALADSWTSRMKRVIRRLRKRPVAPPQIVECPEGCYLHHEKPVTY
jgi:ectoine hydroxylase-related dioxygenase (phytanoyl-CoA dioxygenase family)